MNKLRLEAVTDGIFAIVMTLLVIEIRVPELYDTFSNAKLLSELEHLIPLFLSFFLSFAVLVNYWTSHNFLVSIMAKNVNRSLTYINFIFLSFVSLIPFSSHLLGAYPESGVAVAFYSSNVLIIALLIYWIREYITRSPRIENPEVMNIKLDLVGKFDNKDRFYGTARIAISIICSVLALALSFASTTTAIILLLIPILLGAIPGSLALLLKVTHLEKLAVKEDAKL
jgi:uncharacterized membrane protein